MAKMQVTGIDDLISGLEDLADVDGIIEEMLFEAGNILGDDMKSAIEQAANRGYASGDLAASIVPTAPEKNNLGYFVAVRPVGEDKKGVRNGEKLQYLEHGTSRQQPRPLLKKVAKQSEPKCAAKMQEIFDKHVKL